MSISLLVLIHIQDYNSTLKPNNLDGKRGRALWVHTNNIIILFVVLPKARWIPLGWEFSTYDQQIHT